MKKNYNVKAYFDYENLMYNINDKLSQIYGNITYVLTSGKML